MSAEDTGTPGTQVTLWVDKAEFAVVREQRIFLRARAGMQPGTTLTTDYRKINNECWLLAHSLMVTRFKRVFFVDVNLTTGTRFNGYRKFDVDSSVRFEKQN